MLRGRGRSDSDKRRPLNKTKVPRLHGIHSRFSSYGRCLQMAVDFFSQKFFLPFPEAKSDVPNN